MKSTTLLNRHVPAALLAALLAGCGSMASKPMPAPPDVAAKPAEPGASKRGGYYLDDGPGDNPPADIDAIPDALPRAEPPLERANRPYVALGEKYTPMTAYQPYKASGIASWYGRRYHNNKTSSGEVYDMYAMTAAHPTLPIPSYVRVTNSQNGRSVVVRVNDRGPFKKDRLIDLSYAAAYKLRLSQQGSGPVEVEAIDTRGLVAQTAPKERLGDRAYAAVYKLRTSGASSGAVALANMGTPTVAVSPGAPVPAKPVQAAAPQAAAVTTQASAAAAAPVPAGMVPTRGTYIQVGAYKRKENAEQMIERLRQQSIVADGQVRNWYNGGVYRVRLGPYASAEDVERVTAQIRQQLGISNLVITQQETP